jgi:hypothetical protein
MYTDLVCPSLHMRDIACKSVAGFQSESYRTKRDAPVRFRPTPPAFALSKNTTSGKIKNISNKKEFCFQFSSHLNIQIITPSDGTQHTNTKK